MPKPFRVEVVTRERQVLDRQVVSLIAPAREGYLGVMAGHTPLIAELTVGKLILRYENGQSDVLAISGGFLEVTPEHTIVLAEAAEFAHEIDVERARRALERAQRRLRGESEEQEVDFARARAALMRAINRLRVVS